MDVITCKTGILLSLNDVQLIENGKGVSL